MWIGEGCELGINIRGWLTRSEVNFYRWRSVWLVDVLQIAFTHTVQYCSLLSPSIIHCSSQIINTHSLSFIRYFLEQSVETNESLFLNM